MRGQSRHLKPKQCKVCGASFQPRTGFQKFCSPTCAHQASTVTRTCVVCGTEFTRGDYSPVKHCSKSCANRASAELRANKLLKPRQIAACEECGAPFTKQKMGQRWCSRSCASKARRQPLRIRERYIAGWSLAAKSEPACRNCGRVATHLHHIVPRSKSRAARADVKCNGMPLCFVCHRGWHDHAVEIYRDRLTRDELALALKTAGELWVENHYPYRPDQELRRRYAISQGYSPDEEWRFCLEGREGRNVVDREGQEISRSLVEAQRSEWTTMRS